VTAADAVWLLCAAAITAAWFSFCYGADLRARRHRRPAATDHTTTGGTR